MTLYFLIRFPSDDPHGSNSASEYNYAACRCIRAIIYTISCNQSRLRPGSVILRRANSSDVDRIAWEYYAAIDRSTIILYDHVHVASAIGYQSVGRVKSHCVTTVLESRKRRMHHVAWSDEWKTFVSKHHTQAYTTHGACKSTRLCSRSQVYVHGECL